MFNGWFPVELTATLVQSYIVVRFTHDFLGGAKDAKTDRNAMLVMWLLFAAVVTLSNYITYFEGPAVIFFAVLLFIYSSIFLCGGWLNKIIASVIPMLCISSTSSMLFHSISIAFSKHPYEVLTEPGIPRLLLLTIGQLLLFYLLSIILKFSKKGEVRFTKPESLLIIFVLLISIMLLTLIDLVILNTHLSLYASYALTMCIAGLVVINIVTLYLMSQVSEKNAMTVQNHLLQQKLAYQDRYAEMAKQQYQSTRRIRHDQKQNYSVLGMLISHGEYDKAMLMLEGYIDTELSDITLINTQSETLNAIVNIKLAYAKAAGIKASCMVPEDFDLLGDIEICSVFGNLLDNAIEYCEKHRDRENEISVSVRQDNRRWVILVANTLHGSVLEKNAELKTTKRDSDIHGIGIESVQQTIAKHDGMFSCYEADGMFCAQIVLFNK